MDTTFFIFISLYTKDTYYVAKKKLIERNVK